MKKSCLTYLDISIYITIPVLSLAFVSEEFWLKVFCIIIPKTHVIFTKEINVLLDTKCFDILYFILAVELILLHCTQNFSFLVTRVQIF